MTVSISLGFEVKSLHILGMMLTATPQQLRQAADIQERIEELQNELDALLEGGTTPRFKIPGKHNMSAEGRAAISAAAKRRWAKFRASTPRDKSKRKPKMSAEGRARLAAFAKARWAKVKKAGKSRL